MNPWKCTYAFDRETVVVFEFKTDTDKLNEAITVALSLIHAEEEQQHPSELVGFSVLRPAQ